MNFLQGLFWLFNFYILTVGEGRCYSCSGTCHSENCNCQMGSCPSNQCFIEKKPTEEKGVFRITKGCLRRSPRTVGGCEYDHFNDHILCVCNGTFCNENIFLRQYPAKTVICRKCSERDPECGETCQGQWCHEDSTTGAAGCGYGPPSLPFYHKDYNLLPYRGKLCVTISRAYRGAGKPRRHCICSSNMCNAFHAKAFYGVSRNHDGIVRSRSLATDPGLDFQTCVNCEVNSHDTSVTSSCKQNKCVGHFCTYVSQRHYSVGPKQGRSFHSMSEKQGCINVTDSQNIQLGCTRKWMQNEYEEVLCACQGPMCNRDEFTASSSFYSFYLHLLIPFILIVR